jgi:hypothetical protein
MSCSTLILGLGTSYSMTSDTVTSRSTGNGSDMIDRPAWVRAMLVSHVMRFATGARVTIRCVSELSRTHLQKKTDIWLLTMTGIRLTKRRTRSYKTCR